MTIIQNRKTGQISVEMSILTAIMVGVLLVILLANELLKTSWEEQRERMMASSAANKVAFAINQAVAGGNGTTIIFTNNVGPDVSGMSIYNNRSVRASYLLGGFSSVPVVTSNLGSYEVPINSELVVRNVGGRISIEAG